MRRRRACGLLVLAMFGACREGERRVMPLRHLADEAAARAGAREPTTLTLGRETRYVLAPVAATRETRIEAVADVDGRVPLVVSCPPALAGESAQVLIESMAIEGTDTDASLGVRHDRRIVRCPRTPSTGLPLVVDARKGPGSASVRAQVAPLPTVHAVLDAAPVPPMARLRVAVGVRVFGSVASAGTVHAALRAENARGARHTLWQGELPIPSDERAEAWREIDVPLEPARVWLGSSLRLVFDGVARREGAADVLVAWGDPIILGPPAERSRPAWNVLLVSLDTLRADRLGIYGYPLEVTPNLDRLGREGAVFERASAQANWTLPSHLTMLTGTNPCLHGVEGQERHGATPRVHGGIVPLARALRDAGFTTAAFTEDAYVSADVFHRGFGAFHVDYRTEGQGTAGMVEETVGAGVEWLRRHAHEPFFLFLHTYQTHAPYAPPAAFAARIPSSLPLPPGGLSPSAAAEEDAARYVGEVAFTDAALAPLFTELQALGLAERTIVLVTSDHGEAFGEHGRTGHGTGLFEEQVWVPMLWRAPGLIRAGRRVRGLVGLVDVTPTLLDLLGLAIPPWMQGRSLARELTVAGGDPAVAGRFLPLHGFTSHGLRAPTWKALRRYDGDDIFDLRRDPGERRPVRRTPGWRTAIARARQQLASECARARAALGPDTAPAPVPRIDPERERKLRALGYVEAHP
jgi:arylsulfatase A-like enzyme